MDLLVVAPWLFFTRSCRRYQHSYVQRQTKAFQTVPRPFDTHGTTCSTLLGMLESWKAGGNVHGFSTTDFQTNITSTDKLLNSRLNPSKVSWNVRKRCFYDSLYNQERSNAQYLPRSLGRLVVKEITLLAAGLVASMMSSSIGGWRMTQQVDTSWITTTIIMVLKNKIVSSLVLHTTFYWYSFKETNKQRTKRRRLVLLASPSCLLAPRVSGTDWRTLDIDHDSRLTSSHGTWQCLRIMAHYFNFVHTSRNVQKRTTVVQT